MTLGKSKGQVSSWSRQKHNFQGPQVVGRNKKLHLCATGKEKGKAEATGK